jgi:LmbE family N-acetylglucosaminyl deacetylase
MPQNVTDERTLFLFPHQDDEYFAAPWIVHELASGSEPLCLYLTDGASNVPAAIRDTESLRALTTLGVNESNVAFLGGQQRIPDGKLAEHAEHALHLLETACPRETPLARIYAPAWEGGHHDHDAAHAIALVFARERSMLEETWQFSLYHGYRPLPHPLFRVLSPLPSRAPQRVLRYGFADALYYALLCRAYPSQKRTWAGLFPEAFLRRTILRRESVGACDPSLVFTRPHTGKLLYERLFGARYEGLQAHLSPLLQRLAPADPDANDYADAYFLPDKSHAEIDADCSDAPDTKPFTKSLRRIIAFMTRRQ